LIWIGSGSKRRSDENLHVSVELDDGWLIAQGLEEPAVITQAKSLDELVANIREAAQLLHYAQELHVELCVPPGIPGKRAVTRPARKAG
jgi:predicted RNase H-like HicB family nuclease